MNQLNHLFCNLEVCLPYKVAVVMLELPLPILPYLITQVAVFLISLPIVIYGFIVIEHLHLPLECLRFQRWKRMSFPKLLLIKILVVMAFGFDFTWMCFGHSFVKFDRIFFWPHFIDWNQIKHFKNCYDTNFIQPVVIFAKEIHCLFVTYSEEQDFANFQVLHSSLVYLKWRATRTN